MNRCVRRVYAGTMSGHPCKNKAVVQRDGKWYCKVHDPVNEDAKRKERNARWRVEFDQRMKAADSTQKMLEAYPKLVSALRDAIAGLYALHGNGEEIARLTKILEDIGEWPPSSPS